MTKRKIFFVLILLLIVAGYALGSRRLELSEAASRRKEPAQSYTVSSAPTLFFHGWGSGSFTENQMVRYMERQGITNAVIRADVMPSGKVHLHGRLPKHPRNPIVKVNYLNSRQNNYYILGQWMRNVVVALQQAYHIERFNAVGHSVGNMSIAYYLLQYGRDPALPRLDRQAALGAHFNGVLGADDAVNQMRLLADGQPKKMTAYYRELLALRAIYPKTRTAVLNIYGDLDDGTHSDGVVSNASSCSMRYLAGPDVRAYREVKITGKDGQHSRLHENLAVDRDLAAFLWDTKRPNQKSQSAD